MGNYFIIANVHLKFKGYILLKYIDVTSGFVFDIPKEESKFFFIETLGQSEDRDILRRNCIVKIKISSCLAVQTLVSQELGKPVSSTCRNVSAWLAFRMLLFLSPV